MHTLQAEGHDTKALWEQIGQLCVKTLISVQPHLEHTYFTCRQRSDDSGFGCFELLGFDVIIDHKLKRERAGRESDASPSCHSPSPACSPPQPTRACSCAKSPTACV